MKTQRLAALAFFVIVVVGLVSSRGQDAAKPEGRPSPAERLKLMQGSWVVSMEFEPSQILSNDGRFPKEIEFAKEGAKVTIKGNEIIADGRAMATIANDVTLDAQEKEKGFSGFDLVILTVPSGKGILYGYHISPEKPDEMEFAYTHRARCHRGSGPILTLERVRN